MPKNRTGRLFFALIVAALLFVIGRNVYRRTLNNRMIAAVQAMDVAEVRTLLAQGADPKTIRPPIEGRLSEKSVLDLAMLVSFSSRPQQREEIACLLIQRGAITNQDGKTLNRYLSQACENGYPNLVRCLLEHGADVQATDSIGRKPLEMAIEYRNTALLGGSPNQWTPQQRLEVQASQRQHRTTGQAIIRLLQAHGARLNVGQAVRIEDMNALRTALDTGTKMDVSAGLDQAAFVGNLPAVRLLLQRGANVNSALDTYRLPLMEAITQKHFEVARLLLQQGANPNGNPQQPASTSYTPLVSACSLLPALVPELLQRGANIQAQGGYALAAAINSQNPELVTLMLKHRPSAWGQSGHAALVAAIHYRPDLVRILLTQGADAHETPGQDDELISHCARYGRKDLIVPLYRAGALLSHTAVASVGVPGGLPRTRTTPLIEAIGQETSILRLLLKLGADPNGTNDQGATPLIVAAQTGNVEAAQLLLAHGAKIDYQGKTRHTPLYFARRHSHPEVAAVLQQAGGKEE